jgi:hypothetical protein
MHGRAHRFGVVARVRRTTMTVFAALLLEPALTVVCASDASAKGGGAAVWATQCGSSTYQLSFRPNGQPDLRAGPYRYPSNAAPYLVVYAGRGHPDPLTQFALFLDSNGRGILASTCHPAVAPDTTRPIVKAKSIHKAATLTCRLASEPVIRVATLPDADRVRRLISLVDAASSTRRARLPP